MNDPTATSALSPVDLEVGIHESIPPSVYYARVPGLIRKSTLDLVHKAPACVKAWLDGQEDRDTEAMRFGVALHCAILEPERFVREYAVQPDFGDCRYKGPKDTRDRWRAKNKGKLLLSEKDGEKIRGMAASAYRHPLLSRLLGDGRPELTVRWDHPAGLPAVVRPDWKFRPMPVVIDIKTCEDARPGAFSRSVATYRYHVQEALYRDGLSAVGEEVDGFLFACIEKTPPYLCSLNEIDPDDVERGAESAKRDIERLVESTVKNDWPGYPDGIQRVKLPAYYTDD